MSIKVAIVEDNAGVRDHWARLLDATPGYQCVQACDRAETALQQLHSCQPDVILMDINLPGMSGIECTARMRQALPKARIVIVTVYNDSNSIFKALQAGASGYLLKRVTGEELLRGIAEVMAGGVPMTGEIARKVIESFQRPTPSLDQVAQLTAREAEVLEWLARGFASKEIADRLGISPATVSLHLHHIYEKLHVRSRTEAAAKYFELTSGTQR
jgi:DNA-binding NarL/FixJ family response regulator